MALFQVFIYLLTAVICVPFAKKLGFGSVLGYLIGGIVIGPYVLGFIGQEGHDIMHAAEFGVVMMLFLIGLELNPKEFWSLRKQIIGLGLSQMLFTTILIYSILYFVLGISYNASLSISLALSMSSTAIILQTLSEKGLEKTTAGESSFSVLIFQDLAVIPILILIPLLAIDSGYTSPKPTFINQYPRWLETLVVASSFLVIIILSKFILNPFLNLISKLELKEIFTATALLVVIGASLLMTYVGLTPALGAFLAGILLANSPYKFQIELDIEPFKGLLLGLFFIAVGSTIDFNIIAEFPLQIISIVIIVMLIKAGILFGIGKFFKMSGKQNILFVLLLSQVGEFAFVLLNLSFSLSIIFTHEFQLLLASIAITMFITPVLLLVNEKWIDPVFGIKFYPSIRSQDPMEKQKSKVFIAGFGDFGATIGRILNTKKIDTTIFDFDSDRVDLLRKLGFKVYYGDATRMELLKKAGIEHADIVVAAIDPPEINHRFINMVKEKYPDKKIYVRARNRDDAYQFIEDGFNHIFRENFYSSVEMAKEILKNLNFAENEVDNNIEKFVEEDNLYLRELAKLRKNEKEYILASRKIISEQGKIFEHDNEIIDK